MPKERPTRDPGTPALHHPQLDAEGIRAVMPVLPTGVLLLAGESPATARIAAVNAAFERIVGPIPAIGGPAEDLPCAWFAPDRRTRLESADHPGLAAIQSRRAIPEAERHLLRQDGNWRAVLASAAPTWRDGRVDGAAVFLQPLTRSEAERLNGSEHRAGVLDRRLRVITDAVPALISYVDSAYRYRLANLAYEHWFGQPREEIPGRHVREVLGEGAWEQVRPHMERALRGELVSFEAELPYEGSGPRWVHVIYAPDRDADGNVNGFAVLVTDIGPAKAAERALREIGSRERDRRSELEAIMDAVPAAVFVSHDRDCRSMAANRRAYELLRLEPGTNPSASADPRPAYRVLRDEVEVPPDQLPMQIASASGQPVRNAEFSMHFADGGYCHLIGDAVPLLDAEGRPGGAVGVFVDITRRKEAEEALREADRRKDEFLGVLSHELRNPLTPIRIGLNILERIPPDSPEAEEVRATIDRQVTQMIHLVDDLLEVTRISRGKINLRPEIIELGEVIGRAVEDQRLDFAEKKIELVVHLGSEPLWMEADPVRIAQVVGNILQNAARFTQEGGRAELTLERDGETAVLRVRDNGVGIPADVLARLFVPFMQGDRTLARTGGGLGLGLALVKGLVELHGGSVAAHSDGPGQGAAFTVRLPLAATPPDAGPLEESASAARTRRILVVEDGADAAASLRLALELSGHEVRVVHNGIDAVETAKSFRPEVVLCDIGLPGIDGYEVARRLRAEESLRGVRLIALTGYAQADDRKLAAESGFDHHLPKPPDFPTLERLLGEP